MQDGYRDNELNYRDIRIFIIALAPFKNSRNFALKYSNLAL